MSYLLYYLLLHWIYKVKLALKGHLWDQEKVTV